MDSPPCIQSSFSSLWQWKRRTPGNYFSGSTAAKIAADVVSGVLGAVAFAPVYEHNPAAQGKIATAPTTASPIARFLPLN